MAWLALAPPRAPSPRRAVTSQACSCVARPDLLLRRSQVFVHQRNIRADGFRSLAEGEPVEFEIREDSRSGKVHASRRQLFRLPALPARITSLTWRPVSAATSRS